MKGTCHELLQGFGLTDLEASAALHYIADHLAHNCAPSDDALLLYRSAYRCAIRDAADELRREAGDEHCKTVPQHLLPEGIAA